jgi:hypothetical protein
VLKYYYFFRLHHQLPIFISAMIEEMQKDQQRPGKPNDSLDHLFRLASPLETARVNVRL